MDILGGFAHTTAAAPGAIFLKKGFNPGRDPWSEILDFSRTL
jgi:hypothetical protein